MTIKKDRIIPEFIGEYLPAELVDSTLFRFDVQLQVISGFDENNKPIYRKIEVDMLPTVNLDYENLEIEMARIPAEYAFWSSVYSELRLGVAIAEKKLRARKGKVVESITNKCAADKIRLTADQIKAIAESDAGLIDAELKYDKAQMTCGKVYHMLEALKMKSELARSLAGFKKREQ